MEQLIEKWKRSEAVFDFINSFGLRKGFERKSCIFIENYVSSVGNQAFSLPIKTLIDDE